MWFYVPGENEKAEPWVGQLKVSGQPRELGSFELIRLVELQDLYRNPFKTKDLTRKIHGWVADVA